MVDELCESNFMREHLKINQQIVYTIVQNKEYVKSSKYEFKIDFSNKDHYRLLLEAIAFDTGGKPVYILNLLPLTPGKFNKYDQQEIENLLNYCFYSTLYTTQVFVEKYPALQLRMLIIGNNIFSVLGETVSPVKSTVVGPCRIIPLEHDHVQIKVLDIEESSLKDDIHMLNNIIGEVIKIETNESFIAFRKNYRWLQKFSPLSLRLNASLDLPINPTILFTGGTGGISLTLAKTIATQVKNPVFILISRSHFPDKTSWSAWLNEKSSDDFISKKILKLQEIEKLGGNVYFFQGDVADEVNLSSIINKVKDWFGNINGVVHSAGSPGGGLVQLKSREMAEKVFRPKVYGTYLLCSLLKNEPLNFLILCSSVSSIVGEASQVDYSAANACLDAFPYSGILQSTGTLFKTINWNTWQDVGMAVETARPDNISFLDRSNDIKPAEGAQIFLDSLSNSAKQIIISTIPIENFINQMRLHATGGVVEPNLVERKAILADINYKPPRNQIEQKLVELWQEIFSIDKVGIEDDFFSLGGHSLTALHLINRIERQFKLTISVSTFLGNSTTIESLAKLMLSAPSTTNHSSSIIVPLRSGGKYRPLFCLHPIAGSIFCYSSLAKHLTYDGSIYGIKDPSLDSEELLFNTLEEMASCYLKEIKKIQPEGPYILAGLSFGATLAVEIARQLRQSGDSIQELIFFDGWTKFSNAHNIENIFREKIETIYGTRPEAKRLSSLAWKRMLLLLDYKNKPILEKVVLFKARTLLPEYIAINDPFNYWTKHVKGNIHLHMVPGDHETILDEPNVKAISTILDEILMENFS